MQVLSAGLIFPDIVAVCIEDAAFCGNATLIESREMCCCWMWL